MGILGLSKIIADLAPSAIKEKELKHYFGKVLPPSQAFDNSTPSHLKIIFFHEFLCFYFSSIFTGRKIAIDASMCLYQFLIAVRSEGAQLTSADGETTR